MKKLGHTLTSILVLISTAASAWAAEPTESVVDGVVTVTNPAVGALPPTTVDVQELWRIGGFSDAEEEFFGVISSIVIDEKNQIYILDSQLSEVRVFDASGTYLRTVGREGEGPGEFRRPSDLALLPGGGVGVIQPFPSRMILFDAEGNPSGDFAFEPPEGEGFASLLAATAVGDGLALIYNIGNPSQGEFTSTATLALTDFEGNQKAELSQATSRMSYSNSLCVETEWNNFSRCWAAGKDGRVFARNSFSSYEIVGWNPDGKRDRIIRREYAPHPRESSDIETIKNRWARSIARWVPEPTFEIEENWNPVENIFPRADGTLWVQTSRGYRDLSAGIMARFDVFDENGHYLEEIILEGEFDAENDGMFVDGPYVFVVTDLVSARLASMGGGEESEDLEEEPEPMSVVCYQINYTPVVQKQ